MSGGATQSGDATIQAGGGDLFHLVTCPWCDYSLTTLPPEGVCPECGGKYNQRYIVFIGKGRGEHDTIVGGTWRSWIWLPMCGLFFLFILVRQITRPDPGMIGWIAVGLVIVVTQGYAALFSVRKARAQLWITPRGVTQILSTAEGQRARRFSRNYFWVYFPVVMITVIMFSRSHPLTKVGLSLLVIAFTALFAWLIDRQGQTMVPEVAGECPPLTPWQAVLSTKMKTLSGQRVRVTLRALRSWCWIKLTHYSVADIELELSDEHARALETQIERWRQEAKENPENAG